MPTVWSENDLITAEKLNNTGIDDVLDLGVLNVDLSQENVNYEGNLTDNQITYLDNYRFVKFLLNIEEENSTIELYIPLLQKINMEGILSYLFETRSISAANYSNYAVQVAPLEKKFYFNYSLNSFN